MEKLHLIWELITNPKGQLMPLVAVLIAANTALSAISLVLDKAADALDEIIKKLSPTTEDKAAPFLHGVAIKIRSLTSVLKACIDWITGNRAH